MRLPKIRSRERGMALIFALLALLIISAIGLGMVFMTNTETSINANYKDSQTAFYAMRAGMEEMRDRMRTNGPAPITLPTGWPGQANSVLYIVNPVTGEAFNPWDPGAQDKYGNSVYDNEFCHEYFDPNMPSSGQQPLDVPCGSPYPVGTGFTSTTSYSNSTFNGGGKPPALQNNPLNFKWVRITLKQNATMKNWPSNNNQLVDSGRPNNDPVCFNGMGNQEVTLSSLPGYPFTPNTCAGAFTAGNNVQPVYLVTSLAVTQSGSRRIGQYETAAYNITPPPGTLGLDGPSATYNNGSSNNFTIDGWDGSSPTNLSCSSMSSCQSNYPPGGCAPTGTEFTAVSVADSAGQTNVDNAIEGISPSGPNRSASYIGLGDGPGVPSVSVNPAYAPTGPWGNPNVLNNLVTELANSADVVYDNGGTGCGFHNSVLGQSGSVPGACTIPSPTLGRAGAPQITYANGDLTLTGNTTGYGVLVVTGTLTYMGNFTFNGLVLVVGQGAMVAAGGGRGTFYGSVFVGNTNSHSSPYGQMGALGTPSLNWSGGGTNGIYYNSCYANILGNNLHYMVLSSREEMY
jgi:type IV pilus assembly PilX-like protein